MIELKNNELIWKINFDDYELFDYPFTLKEIIDSKNIFVTYDSENIIMKSSHLWNKRFYDIKK